MKLIINADDYGLSSGINKGIYRLAETGKLNSTSVMVNMAYWESIVDLLPFEGFNIGLHFNLTEGQPIAEPSQVSTLVDANNMFYSTRRLIDRGRRGLVNKDHVALEFTCQFQRLKSLVGNRLTHVDSHQAIHRFRWIYKSLMDVRLNHPRLIIRSEKHFFLRKSDRVYLVNPTWGHTFYFHPLRILREAYYRRIASTLNKTFSVANGNIILHENYNPTSTIRWLMENGLPVHEEGFFEISCHPALDTDGLDHVSDGGWSTKMMRLRLEEYNLLNSLPSNFFEGALTSYKSVTDTTHNPGM